MLFDGDRIGNVNEEEETFIDQLVARCSQYWLQYIHGR